MYQRNRNPINLLTLIALGVLAGIFYLAYDSLIQVSSPAETSEAPILTPIATAPAVAAAPTSVTTEQEADTINAIPQTIAGYESIANAQLLIPAAGISAPIIQVYLDGTSWDVSQLGMNVGHLQGTSWLDAPNVQAGNIVLSGHVEMRDGRQGIFAPVRDLGVGEVIILQVEGQDHRFMVSEVRNVDPSDLSPLYPTDGERLTLITCDDYDFLSNSYQERTVIIAERVS